MTESPRPTDQPHDLVVVAGSDGYFKRLNGAWEKTLGYSEAELLSRKFADFIHPEDLDTTAKLLSRWAEGLAIENFENRYRCKDGSYRRLRWNAFVVPGGVLYGVARDVTDLKEEPAERQAPEARHESILNAVPAQIAILDREGRIVSANPSWASSARRRMHARAGHDDLSSVEGIAPDDGTAAEGIRSVLEGKQDVFSTDYRQTEEDGDLWFRLICSRPANNAPGAVIMRLDVTTEHAARERLEESQANLATAHRIAQIGGWEWDIEHNQLSWSEELCALFGVTGPVGPLQYKDFLAAVHPDDRVRVEGLIDTALNSKAPMEAIFRLACPRGRGRVVQSLAQPVLNEHGAATRLRGVVQDITERHMLQGRLALTDRLAALGTLASGVAHEINNPLAYVVANLAFVHEALQAPPGTRTSAEMIEALTAAREGAERIRVIVRDLKTFSRPDNELSSPLDVRRPLESSLTMAMADIRARATLVKDLRAVPLVNASEARLGQLFLNLLVNAAQAIPSRALRQQEIGVRTFVHTDGRVIVEIHDTGTGIAPEVLPRIFDPFFTTRPVGHGTGLGLSICQSIVRSLGGEIEVESRLGEGSTFRVILPSAERALRRDALDVPSA